MLKFISQSGIVSYEYTLYICIINNQIKKIMIESKIELYKSIALFQDKAPSIYDDKQGYGYKYADLSNIVNKIKPILKECNLGYTQLLNEDSLITILFHTLSGESVESSVKIPQDVSLAKMNQFQVLGSAITYLRRYSLSAILGIVIDEDNDAQGVQVKQPVKKESAIEIEKEWFNPNTKNWDSAIAKKSPLEKIKKFCKISAVNEKRYLEELVEKEINQ